jgi:hypothetical protein
MEALYVLEPGGYGLPPFISGQELATDPGDGIVGREGRLANGVLLGRDQRLLRHSELLANDEGRRAIADWEAGDHSRAQEYEDRRQVELDRQDVDEHAAAGDPVAQELAAIGYPASRSHEYVMSSVPVPRDAGGPVRPTSIATGRNR